MKKGPTISRPMLPLQVFLPAVLATLLFSCSGKDISSKAYPDNRVQKESAVAVSRKGVPAPGETSVPAITIAGGYDELVKALTFVKESLHTQIADHLEEINDHKTIFTPTNENSELLNITDNRNTLLFNCNADILML